VGQGVNSGVDPKPLSEMSKLDLGVAIVNSSVFQHVENGSHIEVKINNGCLSRRA
jgi:exopolysaccharide biosynthesis protein